ncbi:MAG: UDP-N-acetylmuramate--L-alanine ligase [Planctomycetaceae bacterium]
MNVQTTDSSLLEMTVSQSPAVRVPTYQTVHLVGIAGSGMKALAEYLADSGWSISGSEQSEESSASWSLRELGICIHPGHSEKHLSAECDILIHSSAIGPDNPERLAAEKLGIPQFSLSEFLGQMMRDRIGLSIAGTHGKSTTSALLAWIFEHAGLKPSAIVGAEFCDADHQKRSHRNGWAGDGAYLIVESCEFRRNFLNLSPQHAVILGIEPDHFDCFMNVEESVAAYAKFASQLPVNGSLLLNGDCPHSETLRKVCMANVETYSLTPGADWWATDFRFLRGGTRFRVFHREDFLTEICLPLPGRHNIQNALAAVAMSFSQGISANTIREAICEFPGIRRRYERTGYWRGVRMIDDYAHHPTAVASTLQTVRQEFPNRRILCAFQPHQVLRTQQLMSEFSTAFQDADEVMIVPVYTAREGADSPAKDVSIGLARQIQTAGTSCRFLPSLDHLTTTLEDEARPGDVVVTMGAGDIDRVQHEFTRRVQRNHAA